MHPQSALHRTPSSGSWLPPRVMAPTGQTTPRSSVWIENPPAISIRLFSVGHIEPSFLLRDALSDSPDVAVSIARDYRDLWIASKDEAVQLALFHNSLGSFELQESARLVRTRWPKAKIVIIRSGQLSLDHALYDDRIHPPVTTDDLRKCVAGLVGPFREEGDCDGER